MGNARSRSCSWTAPHMCSSSAPPPPPRAPRITFPIDVYSHRGGPLEAPGFMENSMAAFRNSARLQVDLLELDVQMTKDGQVVVFHDRDLGRIFGPSFAGRRMSDLMYEQLPPLGPSPAPMSSAPVSTQGSAQGEAERVPLLQDVFTEFPSFPIQVDIKVRTPGLVKETIRLIGAYSGRRDKLLLGSFIPQVNREIFRTDPGIPLFMSASRVLYLWMMHKLGVLGWAHIHESAAIIPWRLQYRRGRYCNMLDKGFFAALNTRGVAVIVYGERDGFNSEEVYRLVRAAGANAVCTDLPTLLQRLLQTEGPLTPLPLEGAQGDPKDP